MDNSYFDIVQLAKREYARMLEPVCKQYALTRNEVDILLFLYNNPQYDRATDIVSIRGIAKSHVSLSVGTLEEKNLLCRKEHSTDRRTIRLELTQTGQQIAREAHTLQESFFQSIHQGITPEEMEVWQRVRKKIADNINKL